MFNRFRSIALTLLVVVTGWLATGWFTSHTLPAKPLAMLASLRAPRAEREPEPPLRGPSAPEQTTSPGAAGTPAGSLVPPAGEPVPPRPAAIDESPTGPYSSWTTLQDAFEESHRTGKPILIDFNAEWCGPCLAMKREVFQNSVRGRVVQMAVVPVSIEDHSHDPGGNLPELDHLQQHFGVDQFPTLVIFSPETGLGARSVGFTDADQTLQWIRHNAATVRAKVGVE